MNLTKPIGTFRVALMRCDDNHWFSPHQYDDEGGEREEELINSEYFVRWATDTTPVYESNVEDGDD